MPLLLVIHGLTMPTLFTSRNRRGIFAWRFGQRLVRNPGRWAVVTVGTNEHRDGNLFPDAKKTPRSPLWTYTLEDDPMDPENHWLVEENHLPGGQDIRVYVSFRWTCLNSFHIMWLVSSWHLQKPNHGRLTSLVIIGAICSFPVFIFWHWVCCSKPVAISTVNKNIT